MDDVANNVCKRSTTHASLYFGVVSDRLTLVCCISAAGEKLPILVIRTADNPFAFMTKERKKLSYSSNKVLHKQPQSLDDWDNISILEEEDI